MHLVRLPPDQTFTICTVYQRKRSGERSRTTTSRHFLEPSRDSNGSGTHGRTSTSTSPAYPLRITKKPYQFPNELKTPDASLVSEESPKTHPARSRSEAVRMQVSGKAISAHRQLPARRTDKKPSRSSAKPYHLEEYRSLPTWHLMARLGSSGPEGRGLGSGMRLYEGASRPASAPATELYAQPLH